MTTIPWANLIIILTYCFLAFWALRATLFGIGIILAIIDHQSFLRWKKKEQSAYEKSRSNR